MNKQFYKIYHGNLAFSAIEEESLAEVIGKTYFPLLQLVENDNIKLGLEFSGFSLEKIQELRPSWIDKFKKLHEKGLIELIGSGYMQIIGPLVPYKVNIQNQKIGLQVYEDILGITPKIAYINEQTFSKSMIDIYYESGYEAISMEWNNAYSIHKNWKESYSYQPVIIKGNKKSLPILWTDSILFQQFQRTIHNEQNYSDYQDFFNNYINSKHNCIPVYSSDLEIFNYRPGRFETEAVIKNDEWGNISNFCEKLKEVGDFVLPSDILIDNIDKSICLDLTAMENPIIVKKQDKYSLSRWSACGHDSNHINTLCYKYLKKIKKSTNITQWEKLLQFWGSDYRTHTTSKKWKKAIKFLESKINIDKKTIKQKLKNDTKLQEIDNKLIFEKGNLKISFLLHKGLVLDNVYMNNTKQPFGTVKHGELSHIYHMADFFAGSSVIESAQTKKVTDLIKIESYKFNKINTYSYKISTKINMKDIAFEYKSWIINTKKNTITLQIKLKLKQEIQGYIRLGTFTLLSNTQKNIYYKCKNGGKEYEQYLLNNTEINQQNSKSLLQSSSSGVGATNGKIIFKNKLQNIVSIKVKQCKSAPFIMLQNKKDYGKQLTRIYFSVQELDDTLKINNNKLLRKFAVKYTIKF